jgi:hypothetical protein
MKQNLVTILIVAMVVTIVVVAASSLANTALAQSGNKVTICHIPPGNPANAQTITEGAPSTPGHIRNHGDYLGACSP